MRRALLAAGLGGLAMLGLVSAAVLRGLVHAPAPIESVRVTCDPATPRAQAGEPLSVLVWNVQFAGSTKHHFFYDGGEVVHVPAEDVAWSLDAIAEVVRELDPDIVLFQEIDRGSDRTGRVDQHAELLERLDGYPCHTTTPYHRAVYVPIPPQQHLGRVDMHLAVLSRVRLGEARRHQLALLDEAFYRQMLNLHRAILEVEVPIEGGPDLVLLDTHLSAFSRGDGTLSRQVDQLVRVAGQAAAAGQGVLLAGDLNYLPPGDDPARLPEFSQELYQDPNNPLLPLFETLRPSVPPDELLAEPDRYQTYADFGAGHTDRTIDYVFSTGAVRTGALSVRQDRIDISDHQPISVQVVPGVAPSGSGATESPP